MNFEKKTKRGSFFMKHSKDTFTTVITCREAFVALNINKLVLE